MVEEGGGGRDGRHWSEVGVDGGSVAVMVVESRAGGT